jgi:hypothetical protein
MLGRHIHLLEDKNHVSRVFEVITIVSIVGADIPRAVICCAVAGAGRVESE